MKQQTANALAAAAGFCVSGMPDALGPPRLTTHIRCRIMPASL
jgi:hypothetical protein